MVLLVALKNEADGLIVMYVVQPALGFVLQSLSSSRVCKL